MIGLGVNPTHAALVTILRTAMAPIVPDVAQPYNSGFAYRRLSDAGTVCTTLRRRRQLHEFAPSRVENHRALERCNSRDTASKTMSASLCQSMTRHEFSCDIKPRRKATARDTNKDVGCTFADAFVIQRRIGRRGDFTAISTASTRPASVTSFTRATSRDALANCVKHRRTSNGLAIATVKRGFRRRGNVLSHDWRSGRRIAPIIARISGVAETS